MNQRVRTVIVVAVAAAAASCGGSPAARRTDSPPADSPPADSPPAVSTGDRETKFGPLEIGADYASYRRVTAEPFLSLVHGNRWVHVHVNAAGADAYLDGSPIPVGTIVVKSSVEGAGGKPSAVAGPLYIMEKRAPGYAPDHDDWYFAIHWAAPPPGEAKRLGGPIYWRGASPRVGYCYDCHDSYDRSLGGLVPSSLLPR